MKTEDILLYGGIAVVGYMFFIKPKSAVQTVAPVTNAGYLPSTLPITTQTNPIASAAGSLSSIISKLLPTASAPAPTPTASQPAPNSSVYDDISSIFQTTPYSSTPNTSSWFNSTSIAPASNVYNAPAESYTAYQPVSSSDISNAFSNDIFDEEED